MKFVGNILWYMSVEPGGPTKGAVCGKQEVETDTIDRHMWKVQGTACDFINRQSERLPMNSLTLLRRKHSAGEPLEHHPYSIFNGRNHPPPV